MKNKFMKAAALACMAAITLGGLTGCGTPAEKENPSNESQVQSTASDSQKETQSAAGTTAGLTGTISLAGSTSMEKVANALKEGFMEKYPDITVTVEFTGSSAGVEAALAGNCDIGNSSRNLKEEEISKGAAENIIAIDGIAVVTNSSNKVTALTKDQLISLYKGETRSWKDLGGEDMPVVVVGREAGSGTRGAFEEILELADACAYANELDSTGAVMAKVASTPGAIGYVSLDAVDDSVITFSLDGVEANAENVKSGSYFLSRPFVMVTNGAIETQSEAVQTWFEYVMGEEGQSVASQVGLITVK